MKQYQSILMANRFIRPQTDVRMQCPFHKENISNTGIITKVVCTLNNEKKITDKLQLATASYLVLPWYIFVTVKT